MKKFAFIVASTLVIGSTSASRADRLPYFGHDPNHGSYWNSPQSDYPYRSTIGYRSWGYGAYAQASCRQVRARHVTNDGNVYYRTRRVCY